MQTPEKLPDMQNFSVIFDICTDDKNSMSAKQEKEATWENSGAVVKRLARLPNMQMFSKSILDSIRKSTTIKMTNNDCTKNLFVEKYISTNSRKNCLTCDENKLRHAKIFRNFRKMH